MSKEQFIVELEKIGVYLTEKQLEQLHIYYEMLVEWNKVMNLTGITEEDQVYLKHFYDSLTICKVINLNKQENLCDIGTGAGFPGMVIKICFPHLKVILVDSLAKRLNFLNAVIEKLELTNIETVHDRAEEYAIKNREQFDVVTTRAVATLNILLEYCIPSFCFLLSGKCIRRVRKRLGSNREALFGCQISPLSQVCHLRWMLRA